MSFSSPHAGQLMVAAVWVRWSCERRMRLRREEVRFLGTAMEFLDRNGC